MIHLANAVLALGDTAEAEALYNRLLDANYICALTTSASDALETVRSSQPDVLIVGPGLDGGTPESLLKAVKSDPETADIPVFVLSDTPLHEVGDALLAAGADDAAEWPEGPDVVAHRVRPLVRLATMQAELRHRIATAADLGFAVDSSVIPGTEQARILVVGPAALANRVAEALGNGEVARTEELFEAQDRMERERFDAAVLAPGAHLDAYLDFCLQIRRNPRLFNLPVVLLAEDPAETDPVKALGKGASHVLLESAPVPALRFVLNALVRRQRLRWALRGALDRTLGLKTIDTVAAGCYGRPFMENYLARRLGAAKDHERQFAVVGFGFAGVQSIRQEFGAEAEADLLTQIGQWLTLLIRAEDLVARVDGSQFLVTLPDTPIEEAQVVMNRIAGVISNTDFAVQDIYRVVKVWPIVRATGLTRNDTVHTLLERASVDSADLDGAV